jgi:hypothetical protein
MTGPLSGRLTGGAGLLAPYAWRDLPGFVRSTAPDAWWFDVDFCQRALTDVGGVCQADALLVPVLEEHALDALGGRTEDPADLAADITTLEEVQPANALIQRLVAVGRYDVIAVLPTLAAVGGVLAGAAPEDIEDALSDLARAALERGAGAIAVRGAARSLVEPAVARLTPVADYFGTLVVGVTPADGWTSREGTTVEVVEVGRPWPGLAPALFVTHDDLTTSGTAADARHWATGRSAP